ncbi:HD-domain/PDEase-like protein [Trametes versicolor FP-101664 SS1]|uniref:HD-domain/PDEase-like protein n=1 Tax=Trametes versicolor (strain FP-101664) TaxID=717944 RepID=UPI0004621362|nr:HD-domain/PDEase-like protein [Trametes versicolor FP-101664 SS1]EIW62271.1 HD-domain/PDEase-like protein [Trametes versicolor FP-101664 SS1]
MLLDLDRCWTDEHVEGSTSLRRFKDSVHDYLPFGPTICAIIDTPQFQRLRDIKQLGTSYYVWPGASHNRFEHCLGVAYLAQTLAMHLKDSQPSLGITQRDVQCVTIAGLCHDLGHGPWSHVWDSMFIPSILPEKKWCHEDASNMMFDALLVENELDLSPDDAAFVKALIMGDTSMCTQEEKPYLFQIVANKRNGLDVDKFDYIARDSQAIDNKSNLSLTRLIYSSRVIDNEICYDIKDANQIFELCHTRMSLHKRIYTHKTAKAIEYMIVDGLTKAEPVMHIAKRLENPREYLYLTDHIMTEIEASKDPRLAEAQAIFHRIRVRDLYKSVDFKVFPWHCKKSLADTFTPDSVVAAFKKLYGQRGELKHESSDISELEHVEEYANELSPDHVIIEVTGRHHGMGNLNPLGFVKFYSKHNPNKGVEANPDDVSVTLPGAFGEIMLRVYTREPRFFGLVQLGFREVLRGFTIPPAPQSRAATEELEDGGIDIPLDLGPDPLDMLTPPAESPSASAPADGLGTRLGKKQLSRAASANVAGLGATKPRARAATGRSKSAMLDRTSSGRVTDVGENVFTKVPPTYGSTSPTRRAKGQKREREREEERLTEEASTSGAGGVSGEAGGSVKELDLDLELELELDGEGEGAGGSRGVRGRKRSKV